MHAYIVKTINMQNY